MATRVLSVRVRGELIEEARRLGIDIRETVEKALLREIEERKKKHLAKAIVEGLKALGDLDEKEWVETVKGTRRER